MMIVLFIVLSQKQTSYTFGGYVLIGREMYQNFRAEPFLRSDFRAASLGALVGFPSRRIACARVLACVKEEKKRKPL